VCLLTGEHTLWGFAVSTPAVVSSHCALCLSFPTLCTSSQELRWQNCTCSSNLPSPHKLFCNCWREHVTRYPSSHVKQPCQTGCLGWGGGGRVTHTLTELTAALQLPVVATQQPVVNTGRTTRILRPVLTARFSRLEAWITLWPASCDSRPAHEATQTEAGAQSPAHGRLST
jgi:hypothetical protein